MRPRIELTELITRLAITRDVILGEGVDSNCCILTCAVLKRVFKVFGFLSEAIPVSTKVYNERMVKHLTSGLPIPEDEPERSRWFKLTGCYGLGIVPESAIESAMRGYVGYGGHLILRVRDRLVDASLEQASRPQKQIVIPKMIATACPPEFLQGAPLDLNVHGCLIRYERLNDNRFRTAVDWTAEKPLAFLARLIVKRVNEARSQEVSNDPGGKATDRVECPV